MKEEVFVPHTIDFVSMIDSSGGGKDDPPIEELSYVLYRLRES